MKRTLTYISGALLLIAGLCTSCQKEQNSLEEKGAPANEVVIRATISDAATKVSFTEGDNKLKTAWETDDHIVGWDADGNAIELEIASIENNTAIFTPVTGSAAIPTSGKVYMIYAPGKTYENISNSSLEYDLSNQTGDKIPALMTATGEVSNNVLALNFTNRLAIVAVKNPKFPVTKETNITGLQLSGDNIWTMASFSEDESGGLQMNSSELGTITRACNFTTAANGTSETMVYFAVLPNATEANVTVSTSNPTGYQISFSGKSFEAGQCYMLTQSNINKQKFAITVQSGITNGTITTDPSSGASVAWGETVTVTATPATGYELATLTYNDGSDQNITVTGNTGTFTMPKANVTVSGTFQKKNFTITATGTEASGTYTVTGGTYTIKKGDDVVTTAQMGDVITVTAAPAAGYELVSIKWKGEGCSDTDITTEKKFTMPAKNVTVTVTFKKTDYTITKTTAVNGSFTVKRGDSEVTTANYQDDITISATPEAGYVVDAITVKDATDASVTVTNGNFTMPAKAVTVSVTFKAQAPGTTPDYDITPW